MRNIIVFDNDPWVNAMLNKLRESMPINITFIESQYNLDNSIDYSSSDILITNEKQTSLNILLQTVKKDNPKLKLILLQEPARTHEPNLNVDLVLEKPVRESELLGSLAKVLHP